MTSPETYPLSAMLEMVIMRMKKKKKNRKGINSIMQL